LKAAQATFQPDRACKGVTALLHEWSDEFERLDGSTAVSTTPLDLHSGANAGAMPKQEAGPHAVVPLISAATATSQVGDPARAGEPVLSRPKYRRGRWRSARRPNELPACGTLEASPARGMPVTFPNGWEAVRNSQGHLISWLRRRVRVRSARKRRGRQNQLEGCSATVGRQIPG
jgi:hypothetical protein